MKERRRITVGSESSCIRKTPRGRSSRTRGTGGTSHITRANTLKGQVATRGRGQSGRSHRQTRSRKRNPINDSSRISRSESIKMMLRSTKSCRMSGSTAASPSFSSKRSAHHGKRRAANSHWGQHIRQGMSQDGDGEQSLHPTQPRKTGVDGRVGA